MKPKMGEKGFTLIELLVGITIAAVIIGAASMTVVTMMRLTPQSNNWAIALRQVQNAGHWISRDVQMSQGDIDINPDPATFLTLTLPQDQNPDNNKTIAYLFEDMGNGLQRLMRDDAGQQIMIAEFISPDNTTATYPPNCTSNCTLTFTITATSGDAEVTRDYEVMQRVQPAPTP